ncbi:MAG TPA: cbb3-type cytochrome c oxidase subunit I [Vicinamibacterales bacterium]|nr:cbb3-type cytochrome c oxidase subunit I [Vicinamibacterales bacterium]
MADAGVQTSGDVRRLRRVTFVWMALAGLLFLAFALDGEFLRLYQSRLLFFTMRPELFYAVLTLHGVGMVGLWLDTALAAASYLLARYIRPPVWASWLALAGTLVALALLVVTTTEWLFGAGWYFLYPLPFESQGTWSAAATAAFFVAMAILCGVWLLWSLATIAAILKRYPLRVALGWRHLSGRAGSQGPDVPPLVLIALVALIPAVAGFVDAFAVFAFYVIQWRVKDFVANALLMKNLTFFFIQMTAYATMYLGVGIVYELLPAFAGRPWKMNRLIVLAWNAALVLVLFSYLNHLYMDYAQPQALQVTGQVVSYFSAVPAAVVSIFDGLLLVYGARMRWTVASALMFLGLMGWAIGGVGAVIDSTISVNSVLHNTLWVPAHFHTYYVMGVVLMLLGFASHLGVELSGIPDSRLARFLIVPLLLVGGYGFVLTLFWAGAHSIPRRYAVYPDELRWGIGYARTGVAFIAVLILGVLLFLLDTGRRYVAVIGDGLRL